MSQRLKLHKIFTDLLGTTGKEVTRVYFQPPSNIEMKYPAIVYSRSRMHELRANNKLYRNQTGYMVTVIDPNPDSLIPDRVLNLPLCRFVRHYTANNLNHDVFDIYY